VGAADKRAQGLLGAFSVAVIVERQASVPLGEGARDRSPDAAGGTSDQHVQDSSTACVVSQ
jgi:hypothetical protein